MKDDVSRALEILNKIDDPHEERHEDEALSVLMSIAKEPHAISTAHPSVSPLTSNDERLAGDDDPATDSLRSIASGEDKDIECLTALARGESYDNWQ